jgi:hypothetical protein
MNAEIERLIVTRFDLAYGLDLLRNHRPLRALGAGRDTAGALADLPTYKAVVQGPPFSLSSPRRARLVPTGWSQHGSKFWRGFNEAYITQREPQAAQALPLRIKVADPVGPPLQSPDPAARPVISAWVWPFAVANQLAVDRSIAIGKGEAVELPQAGIMARELLAGTAWTAGGGLQAVNGNALLKAHRDCVLDTLFPAKSRPKPGLRVHEFTITTVLATRDTDRSPFQKWTLRDQARAFTALSGKEVPTEQVPSISVTVADMRLNSFCLLSFGENSGQALLYLTQGQKPRSAHWSWCLTMNVAHFVMVSLALACLAEDLRHDAGRAEQRAGALGALGALRDGYKVNTGGKSIGEQLYKNHAWISRALQ